MTLPLPEFLGWLLLFGFIFHLILNLLVEMSLKNFINKVKSIKDEENNKKIPHGFFKFSKKIEWIKENNIYLLKQFNLNPNRTLKLYYIFKFYTIFFILCFVVFYFFTRL